VVPLNPEGISHYLLAATLGEEGGIGLRNGCFCAHPYMLALLGVDREQAGAYQQEIRDGTRVLPGLVRASFGCYNTTAEIDWFAEMLCRIARGQYQSKHVRDPISGACHAEGFARNERYFAP
jgi:cysteine desulfurase / selenocysteine lyase